MIIKCPKCNKDISSEAYVCPFCGQQIRKEDEKEIYTVEQIKQFEKESVTFKSDYGTSLFGGVIALALGFIFSALFFIGYALRNEVILVLFYILAPVSLLVGILCLAVSYSINKFKYNNRIKKVEEYKKTHPEYKGEEKE